MIYAHVTDGQVDRVGLPDTWTRPDGSSVSGYPYLTTEEHNADGWFSITEIRAALGEGEFHGPPTYTVVGDEVTAHYPAVADGPVPEITLADVAAALRDPLANLTASSASTTVRTAILNQRAALDELLAVLETP